MVLRRPARDHVEHELHLLPHSRPSHLTRSSTDRKIGGVAGGVAAYFGIDPLAARLGFAIGTLFSGAGLVAYLLMLALVPRDDAAPAGAHPHPGLGSTSSRAGGPQAPARGSPPVRGRESLYAPAGTWTASTPTASPPRSASSPRWSSCRPSTPTRSPCGGPPAGCSRPSRSSAAPSGAPRSSRTTRRSPPRPRPARPGASTTRRAGCALTSSATGALAGTLLRARACYVCKQRYREVDAFYHQLCPACAALNHEQRDARTDLTGRRALLTGGRAKIGMYIALRLLRDGAHTTITTRFPHDAVRRFAAMADSADWLHRLRVVGIDLRDPARSSRSPTRSPPRGPLDVLVNNAAQTVRRSPGAYAHLVAAEQAPLPRGPLPEVRDARPRGARDRRPPCRPVTGRPRRRR